MTSVRVMIFACFLLMLAPWGVAQDSAMPSESGIPLETPAEVAPYRIDVFWENDGTVLKPQWQSDRHYTNGVGLGFTHQPQWADDLAAGLGLSADGTAAGFLLSQEIYTPNDIIAPVPEVGDRPYTGYLYGGVFWQRERADQLDHVQLNLGVIGDSSLAEETQLEVHRVFEADRPNGWDYQQPDYIAANITYRRTARFNLPPLPGGDHAPSAHLLPYGEVNAGTVHINAALGGTVRVGWNLPDDFGPSRLDAPGSFTASPQRSTRWSIYGFGRGEARYVAWNALVERDIGRAPEPDITPKEFVAEGELGLAVGYRWDATELELAYSQVFLTHEFEEQKQQNGFGRLALSIVCPF